MILRTERDGKPVKKGKLGSKGNLELTKTSDKNIGCYTHRHQYTDSLCRTKEEVNQLLRSTRSKSKALTSRCAGEIGDSRTTSGDEHSGNEKTCEEGEAEEDDVCELSPSNSNDFEESVSPRCVELDLGRIHREEEDLNGSSRATSRERGQLQPENVLS